MSYILVLPLCSILAETAVIKNCDQTLFIPEVVKKRPAALLLRLTVGLSAATGDVKFFVICIIAYNDGVLRSIS